MPTVIVEIPYRNASRRELLVDALERVFAQWSRQECFAYLEQQLAENTVRETGEVPAAGHAGQTLRITLDIDDEHLARARQHTSTQISNLAPEIIDFLFGDAEPSGQMEDSDLDDINRAIEIAEMMTPEERAAVNSAGQREIAASPEMFAQLLQANLQMIQQRARAILSETQSFEPGPAVTSSSEERLDSINALLESRIGSEDIRPELLAERNRLRAVIDARVSAAEALPLPDIPRISPEDEELRELIHSVPLAGSALTMIQLQEAQANFSQGVIRGYATELPEGGHEAHPLEPQEHAQAFAGYLYGIGEGVALGVGGLVSTVVSIVTVIFNNSLLGISIDLVDEGWDAYVERRQGEISSAVDQSGHMLLACQHFQMEFEGDPARVGSELGTVLGRVLAQEVDEFINDTPYEKGRKIGVVVGAILLEIVGELLLTAATGGAAPVARAGTAAVQAAQAGIRGARFAGSLRRLLRSAPVIQRFLRKLGRIGNATDAIPTLPMGAADELSDAAGAMRRLPDDPPAVGAVDGSSTGISSAIDSGAEMRQFGSPVDYMQALRSGEIPTHNDVGPAWNWDQFDSMPEGYQWQPGDPIDAPYRTSSRHGTRPDEWIYPTYDSGVPRSRYWRNRADHELQTRRSGQSAHDPNSSDPLVQMPDDELEAMRNSSAPRAPQVDGHAMELEHVGVPQRATRALENLGFDPDDVRVITGDANPNNLLEVDPLEHPFFDGHAHSLNATNPARARPNPRRADADGQTWEGTLRL